MITCKENEVDAKGSAVDLVTEGMHITDAICNNVSQEVEMSKEVFLENMIETYKDKLKVLKENEKDNK